MHMVAPLGVLSPHLGAGYGFSGADSQAEIDTVLWGSIFGNSTSTTLGSPPAAWTPTMADMFMKIDGKLKVSGTRVVRLTQRMHVVFYTRQFKIYYFHIEADILAPERIRLVGARQYQG